MTQPADHNEEVSDLKILLVKYNVSQQDLSKIISTSRVALNQVLNSKRGLTPLMALKLEAALGVPAREILTRQLITDLDKTYRENSILLENIRRTSQFRDLAAVLPAGG